MVAPSCDEIEEIIRRCVIIIMCVVVLLLLVVFWCSKLGLIFRNAVPPIWPLSCNISICQIENNTRSNVVIVLILQKRVSHLKCAKQQVFFILLYLLFIILQYYY